MAIEGLVSLMIYLLLAGILLYILYWILGMLSLPPQVRTIVLLIIGVVFLIYLLRTLGLV